MGAAAKSFSIVVVDDDDDDDDDVNDAEEATDASELVKRARESAVGTLTENRR